MMTPPERLGIAPNYTNAFLVSAGVLCLVVLMAIWAVWGFIAALVTGYLTDKVIALRTRRAAVMTDGGQRPEDP